MVLKEKEINFLFGIAQLAAAQSSAIRLKVGGVITDSGGNFIAYSYNGTPRGFDNCCEHRHYPSDDKKNGLIVTDQIYDYYDFATEKPYRLKTKDSTIHCEANLVAHAARRGISVNEGKVFLTHSPCESCSALLVQCGIKDVYFLQKFRTYDAVLNNFKHALNINQWKIQ